MKKRIFSILSLLICICILFAGCDSVSSMLSGENAEIKYSVENGEATVTEVPNKSTVKEIEIPDEYEGVPVTKIADYSAFNLEYVTEIKIGKNVREIGEWSMTNNQHLEVFIIDEANPYFCSVDGVIYTKDMKTLVYCPAAKTGEYTVADGVEIVRSKAFYKCGKLTKITFPDSVKEIQEKALFRCGELTELVLPQGIEAIGKDAFSYCEKITEVTIPSSIKTIGDYAFYNCKACLTVNVEANEKDLKLGEKWFPTNNGLDIAELNINWK